MKIKLDDLKAVIDAYEFAGYSTRGKGYELEIRVENGDDPSTGDIANVLELTYDNEDGERKIAEIFDAKSEAEPRVTTHKTKILKRKE